MQRQRTVLEESMQPLLTIKDLARLLARSPATLKRDLQRNPAAVPPLVRVPGTRLLRWREEDVIAWLATHAKSIKSQRRGEDE